MSGGGAPHPSHASVSGSAGTRASMAPPPPPTVLHRNRNTPRSVSGAPYHARSSGVSTKCGLTHGAAFSSSIRAPAGSEPDRITWPVRVAASRADGLEAALVQSEAPLAPLVASLFGRRRPGDRGVQAATTALGPIVLNVGDDPR